MPSGIYLVALEFLLRVFRCDWVEFPKRKLPEVSWAKPYPGNCESKEPSCCSLFRRFARSTMFVAPNFFLNFLSPNLAVSSVDQLCTLIWSGSRHVGAPWSKHSNFEISSHEHHTNINMLWSEQNISDFQSEQIHHSGWWTCTLCGGTRSSLVGPHWVCGSLKLAMSCDLQFSLNGMLLNPVD